MKETTIQNIGLDKIRPSKTNPRKHFDENYITELSDSIRAKGILQPLLARPDWCIGKTDEEISEVGSGKSESGNGNGAVEFFEIVAGECRYRGASRANLAEAPAIIRLLSDKETLEIQLIENLQRSDLTAVEEAEAYRRLIDEMGYTAELIHEKTGKALNTIYGKLKMLRAPKFLLDALEKGIIGERHCELVGRIPVPEMRERAGREILKPAFQEDPLNYRKAAAHVSDNYMRPLSGAQFDPAAAGLVSIIQDEETGERIGGGACTDCPMKTGNRPELFGDLKRTDICTNPKCFNRKSDAHFALLQKTAEGQGKKLLSSDEAAEIFEDNGNLWFDSSYVKLSDKPDPREVRSDFAGRIPHWKTLLENLPEEQTIVVPSKDQKSGVTTMVKRTEKFKKPQIVIAKDPRGRIVELVDRGLAIEAVNLAAKEKGNSLFDTQKPRAGSGRVESGEGEPEPDWKKQDRKNREIAKLNFQITLGVMTALIEAIDKKGVVKGFWDALIEASITHAGHDGAWLMCKRLGLDPKKGKWKEGVATEGVQGAALEYGLTLPDEKFKLGFVVELLLSQRVKFSGNSYSGGLKHVEVLKNFLDIYKIDVGSIEKRVKEEARVKGAPRGNGKPSSTIQRSQPSLEAGNGANLSVARHRFDQIADNKYRCKRCAAFAVKHEGKFVLAKEFRGKPCVGQSAPKAKKKKCSHCSNSAAPGKSMCSKCLAKNSARAKARRAKTLLRGKATAGMEGGAKNG